MVQIHPDIGLCLIKMEIEMLVIKERGQRVPIKAWVDGVPVEPEALDQLKNVSQLPFVYKHVAVMPDVHWGMGATVGSVIATKGAIIPAAVGVDIGCGMMALKTNLKSSDLPDNLHKVRTDIERMVPHGRTNDGQVGDRGAWHDVPEHVAFLFMGFNMTYQRIIEKHPAVEQRRHPVHHLGTLGTGNHFIEVCIDDQQDVWVMLHSGSRGIGNRIGTYFIQQAKREMEKYHITPYLPDTNLSYLVEHTELYDDYVKAVHWAQEFALLNRKIMMGITMDALRLHFPDIKISLDSMAVNCHHNYVEMENHFGENVHVTRKGAVRAREGDFGVIPGSMGAKSFIVKGKGCKSSFNSCSHGAGRRMSRKEAKRKFTLEQHNNATKGVECRRDADVIDETPMAYKDIDAVMNAQGDLVEVVRTLKQVVCVKG